MKMILGLILMVSLSACAASEKKDKGAAEAAQAKEEAQAEAADSSRGGGVDAGKGPTGPDFLKQGWKKIADCPGHEFKYLIEKSKQRKVCSGVMGFVGPVENPCEPFTGKVAEFKKCLK